MNKPIFVFLYEQAPRRLRRSSSLTKLLDGAVYKWLGSYPVPVSACFCEKKLLVFV